MTIVQYTQLHHLPSQAQYEASLNKLPLHLKNKITAYAKFSDRALRLVGKLLLIDCINKVDVTNQISINNLECSNYGKPMFKQPLSCSLSYANNMAIVTCSTNTQIGIDIELLRPIDIHLYQDYFTKKEWRELQLAINTNTTFFDMWTRKEAIIKAIGKGFFMNLNTIEVLKNTVSVNDVTYTLQKLAIHSNYCCHLATNISCTPIITERFDIFEAK